MIFSMLLALCAIAMLPVVFMAALNASAEAHPRSPVETIKAFGRPLATDLARAASRLRRLACGAKPST